MDQMVLRAIVVSNVDVSPISEGLNAIGAMTTFMVIQPVNLADAILMDRSTLAVLQMGDVLVMLDTLE